METPSKEHLDDQDRITDEDKAWFKKHPDRSYRLRYASESEIWMVTQTDPLPEKTACVIAAVYQAMPGLRMRQFYYFKELFRKPDEASDEEAKKLFEFQSHYRDHYDFD